MPDDLFVRLFEAVAACEAPKGTQVDDVLADFQAAYDAATGHVTFFDGSQIDEEE